MLHLQHSYCHIHPQEVIINFCTKEQCQVSLCANCICEHTREHSERGDNPIYENIRDTTTKTWNKIHEEINKLSCLRDRIGEINCGIFEKRKKARETIGKAKKECLEVLEKYFEEKEKIVIQQISNEEIKLNVHCKSNLLSLDGSLSREIDILRNTLQEFDHPNLASLLPRTINETLPFSNRTSKEVLEEVERNENFFTTLSCQEEFFKQIPLIIDKSFSLSFSGIFEKPARVHQYQNEGRIAKRSNSVDFTLPLKPLSSSFSGLNLNFGQNKYELSNSLPCHKIEFYSKRSTEKENQIIKRIPHHPVFYQFENTAKIISNLGGSQSFNTERNNQHLFVTPTPINFNHSFLNKVSMIELKKNKKKTGLQICKPDSSGNEIKRLSQ